MSRSKKRTMKGLRRVGQTRMGAYRNTHLLGVGLPMVAIGPSPLGSTGHRGRLMHATHPQKNALLTLLHFSSDALAAAARWMGRARKAGAGE